MTLGNQGLNIQGDLVDLAVEAVVMAIRTEGTSLVVMTNPLRLTRTIVRRGMNRPKAGGQVSGVVLHWVALRLIY